MIVETRDKRKVRLTRFDPTVPDKLLEYLHDLSPETRKRFGPHLFDRQSLSDFYLQTNAHSGYTAEDIENGKIVAYAIIKAGYVEGDFQRYMAYGANPDQNKDCQYAPSVSDNWQSCGIGNLLFHFLLANLRQRGIKRIILWGGVQADNEKAVNFYRKNHFITVGDFFHHGNNFDMMREI